MDEFESPMFADIQQDTMYRPSQTQSTTRMDSVQMRLMQKQRVIPETREEARSQPGQFLLPGSLEHCPLAARTPLNCFSFSLLCLLSRKKVGGKRKVGGKMRREERRIDRSGMKRH